MADSSRPRNAETGDVRSRTRAAKPRRGADEIAGAGDPSTLRLSMNELDGPHHAFPDSENKRAGELGPAPFPRTGLQVESEESVPTRLR